MWSFIQGLRFRNLVILGLALLIIDLLIPDPIPFVDELLIAIVTLILSRFKRHRPAGTDNRTANGANAFGTEPRLAGESSAPARRR